MNALGSVIKLNNFIADLFGFLFDKIFTPITNFINDLIGTVLNWLIIGIYQLIIVSLSRIVDALEMIFYILAGIESPVYINKSVETTNFNISNNLLLDLLFNPQVMTILLRLAILSIFLLIIFTFIAIIKAEYSYDGKTVSKMSIVGKSLKALMSFIFVPIMALFGVFASSMLLQSLNEATKDGSSSTIGTQIVIASAYSSNRVRENDKYFRAMVNDELNDMGVFIKEASGTADNTTREVIATTIDIAFKSKMSVFPNDERERFKGDKTGGAFGRGVESFDVFLFDMEEHFDSKYTKENENGGYANFAFDIGDPYLMFYYYNLWNFNYIVALGSLLIVAWIFIKIMLGLCKRIFEVMMLFLAAPIAISMMPLDNGSALKNWKERFIGRVAMVFAPVVIMNLFLFLLGWISNIDILTTVLTALSGGVAPERVVEINGFQVAMMAAIISPQVAIIIMLAQNILSVLFIIAGAKLVEESSGWISEIFGFKGNNVVSDGQGILSSAARTVAMGKRLGIGKHAKDVMAKGNKDAGSAAAAAKLAAGAEGAAGAKSGIATAPINEGSRFSRYVKAGAGNMWNKTVAGGKKVLQTGGDILGMTNIGKVAKGGIVAGAKAVKGIGLLGADAAEGLWKGAKAGVKGAKSKISEHNKNVGAKNDLINDSKAQRDKVFAEVAKSNKEAAGKMSNKDMLALGNLYNSQLEEGMSKGLTRESASNNIIASIHSDTKWANKLSKAGVGDVSDIINTASANATKYNEANAKFNADKKAIDEAYKLKTDKKNKKSDKK